MVKLNRIYTRTGDDGSTGLVSGARISKASLRVQAYGDVDEANAAIGLAICAASDPRRSGPQHVRLARELRAIQNDLFDLGADLATPPEAERAGALRIIESQTARLEHLIDDFNESLQPLRSFVLPGGSPLAAALHLARTITRRAERSAVALMQSEPTGVNPEAVKYLNRLSDLLFVLARIANDDGAADELWVPGANRA